MKEIILIFGWTYPFKQIQVSYCDDRTKCLTYTKDHIKEKTDSFGHNNAWMLKEQENNYTASFVNVTFLSL